MGEVVFLTVLVVERTEGTVDFRASVGAGDVDPVEDATEALRDTDDAEDAPVKEAREGVAVFVPSAEGVFDARTDEGLAVPLVRVVGEAGALVAVPVPAVFTVGVLVGLAVEEMAAGFLLVPARPAAAKEDILVLTLGELSVIMLSKPKDSFYM